MRIAKTGLGAATDRTLLLGAINDAYEEIGKRHPWSRLRDTDTELVMVPIYETGTVELTAGATTVALTGGTFTSLMTGRRLRVSARPEYYQFTYSGAAAGSIERNFEGDTGSGQSFELFQPIYALPTGCDVIKSIKSLSQPDPLTEVTQEELDRRDPERASYGRPSLWAAYEDANNLMRIEAWPAPELAETLIANITLKFTRLTSASQTFFDWLPEGLLYQGAMMMLGDPNAPAHFERLLGAEIRRDCARMGASRIKQADEFTAHRRYRSSEALNQFRRRSQM
jgi:hypothetical protein